MYSLTRLGLGVLHDYGEKPEALAALIQRGPALLDPVEQRAADADAPGAAAPRAQDEAKRLIERIRFLDTLKALGWIAQHLRNVPGAKRIIWLSAGFPIRVVIDNLPDWNRAMDEISDCNVAVYAVDSSGVRTTAGFAADCATTRVAPVPRVSRANAANDVLKEAAFRTGGLVFENTNDLRSAVEAALRDSECVYRLTYTPDRPRRDGRFVPIEVKVSRRSVSVGHRAGYYASAEVPMAAVERDRALLDAIHSPVNATGIGLTVRVTAVEKGISVMLVADPSSVALRCEGAGYTGGFDIRYAQKTVAGVIVADSTDEVSLALNQAQYERVKTDGFAYSKRLVQAPGATSLKIAVCDHLSGIVGSISIPLDTLGAQTAFHNPPAP